MAPFTRRLSLPASSLLNFERGNIIRDLNYIGYSYLHKLLFYNSMSCDKDSNVIYTVYLFFKISQIRFKEEIYL